ncbi:hypothetical protein BT93_B1038 [Corymbia citriodora subsp. variegata]|nr:hypothetical protein BT93_B1038 [Corymbia citriodora subsp. variegata]
MARGLPRKEEEEARKSRLQLAIANDDVDELHNLIREEPKLLDRLSNDPFPNTPLHLAAAAGKTQMAMEIAILKPLFRRKLNSEGDSPMHLALQFERYQTVRALMTLDHKLIRVRGRYGFTPLHYVAKREGENELELLAEFLWACKSSIEDLTSRCETAVHVAVQNSNLEAFKVLFSWLKRAYLTEILNWKNEDGRTVLDIVHLKKQNNAECEKLTKISDLLTRFQITDWLVGYVRLNSSGHQDLAEESRPPSGDFSISQYLRKEPTVLEKYSIWFSHQNESARNIILLVATLIATASYQAGLSPPGGYWGDNSSNPPANSTVVAANSSDVAVEKPHKAGDLIMSGKYLYEFTVFNSFVFMASIITIWSHAIPQLPHTFPVYLLVATVGMAYFGTATIAFPKSDKVAALRIEAFYMIFLTAVLWAPLFLWAKDYQYKLRLRADAIGRHLGNSLKSKDLK